ncbi:hypothetical protein [Chromobacterium violaceum]|uniref:hypothetical protein n=1 Tax=Chromobacterium violaceum TaxID=536 RepID=UPI0011C07B44|nr:hypothetical protein [Chromobacterium violaceum]
MNRLECPWIGRFSRFRFWRASPAGAGRFAFKQAALIRDLLSREEIFIIVGIALVKPLSCGLRLLDAYERDRHVCTD